MKKEIIKLNAHEIGYLLDRKEVDPIQLVEAYYDNYKNSSRDTTLSVSNSNFKKAKLEAERSWYRQKENKRLSFFDGIPASWKDVIDVKGMPAYGGSNVIKKLRKDYHVSDAKAVENAKKKGIVSLFKTSTVEFAFGGLGINNTVKYPKNQFLLNSYCPGGSSSGAAVSVYKNLVPLSVGTDTAGSIRIPAAWHSLIGFKPTYGSISSKGILPLSRSYDTVGLICKCIKDIQIFYNILSKKNYKYKIDNIKKCKIGLVQDFTSCRLKDKDKEEFEQFIEILSKNDFKFKRITIPQFNRINTIISEKGAPVNYEAWHAWKENIEKNLAKIDKNVVSRFILGKKMTKKDFLEIRRHIAEYKTKIYKKFVDVDFFLFPTLSIKPPRIEKVLNTESYNFYNNLVLNDTRVVNLFNFCAVTIPIKKNNWISFTLASKEKNDQKILSMAEQIENSLYNIY